MSLGDYTPFKGGVEVMIKAHSRGYSGVDVLVSDTILSGVVMGQEGNGDFWVEVPHYNRKAVYEEDCLILAEECKQTQRPTPAHELAGREHLSLSEIGG